MIVYEVFIEDGDSSLQDNPGEGMPENWNVARTSRQAEIVLATAANRSAIAVPSNSTVGCKATRRRLLTASKL
jgi:hypothetical protein